MKTLVLGATPNKNRYAYHAAVRLDQSNYEFIPVGIKKGEVLGKKILNLKDRPRVENVHTITLYIGTHNQPEWYEYILSLNPNRIIFNPGTENQELVKLAENQGIETEYACTLTMLAVGNYS